MILTNVFYEKIGNMHSKIMLIGFLIAIFFFDVTSVSADTGTGSQVYVLERYICGLFFDKWTPEILMEVQLGQCQEVRREYNYAFTGEQIRQLVAIRNLENVADIQNVDVSLDNTLTIKCNDVTNQNYCNNNKWFGRNINCSKLKDGFNPTYDKIYECVLTVTDDMSGVHDIAVEAYDQLSLLGSSEKQSWKFNRVYTPSLNISVSDGSDSLKTQLGDVGQTVYSLNWITIMNTGGPAKLFIGGTDYSGSGVLKCPYTPGMSSEDYLKYRCGSDSDWKPVLYPNDLGSCSDESCFEIPFSLYLDRDQSVNCYFRLNTPVCAFPGYGNRTMDGNIIIFARLDDVSGTFKEFLVNSAMTKIQCENNKTSCGKWTNCVDISNAKYCEDGRLVESYCDYNNVKTRKTSTYCLELNVKDENDVSNEVKLNIYRHDWSNPTVSLNVSGYSFITWPYDSSYVDTEVSYDDSKFEFKMNGILLTKLTKITIDSITPSISTVFVHSAYKVELPQDFSYDSPIELTMKFNPNEIKNINNLSIYKCSSYDSTTKKCNGPWENNWIKIPSEIDTKNNVVIAEINSFSAYALGESGNVENTTTTLSQTTTTIAGTTTTTIAGTTTTTTQIISTNQTNITSNATNNSDIEIEKLRSEHEELEKRVNYLELLIEKILKFLGSLYNIFSFKS
jgi:hypothetical protein